MIAVRGSDGDAEVPGQLQMMLRCPGPVSAPPPLRPPEPDGWTAAASGASHEPSRSLKLYNHGHGEGPNRAPTRINNIADVRQ